MTHTSSVVSIKSHKTTWYLSGKWKLPEKNIPCLQNKLVVQMSFMLLLRINTALMYVSYVLN